MDWAKQAGVKDMERTKVERKVKRKEKEKARTAERDTDKVRSFMGTATIANARGHKAINCYDRTKGKAKSKGKGKEYGGQGLHNLEKGPTYAEGGYDGGLHLLCLGKGPRGAPSEVALDDSPEHGGTRRGLKPVDKKMETVVVEKVQAETRDDDEWHTYQ